MQRDPLRGSFGNRGFHLFEERVELMPWSAPVRAPDLGELETLAVCAAEGSMVAAAARLGISRPAVAKRIRNLEALAGRPLLHRGARGVRLTDAGATLQASARRMLTERDLLASALIEIRGEDPSAIAGLRGLLGHSPAAARAAHQPEARLTETERVLELVLQASATGVVISDPQTSVVHEVNDAFCRITGRTRAELVSQPATAFEPRYKSGAREEVIQQVRRLGVAERVVFEVRRPDGTVRVGETTARFITLAGTQQLLSTVDDVTEQHRFDAERTATLAAYRAITKLGVLLLAGKPLLESITSMLAELRRSGGFSTALLWDLEQRHPVALDGDQPPPALELQISRGHSPPSSGVRILSGSGALDGAEVSGWEVALRSTGHALILLSPERLPSSTRTLFTGVLADLAALAGAQRPAMTEERR
jgi:PAS domain S-box-containing protein